MANLSIKEKFNFFLEQAQVFETQLNPDAFVRDIVELPVLQDTFNCLSKQCASLKKLIPTEASNLNGKVQNLFNKLSAVKYKSYLQFSNGSVTFAEKLDFEKLIAVSSKVNEVFQQNPGPISSEKYSEFEAYCEAAKEDFTTDRAIAQIESFKEKVRTFTMFAAQGLG